MRATNLRFRSPKDANVPYCYESEFNESTQKSYKKFYQGPRWQHGSIYEPFMLHSPKVGPSSYQIALKSKQCSAVYQPSYIETITNQKGQCFEYVNGAKILQVGYLSRKDQSASKHLVLNNSITPNKLSSWISSQGLRAQSSYYHRNKKSGNAVTPISRQMMHEQYHSQAEPRYKSIHQQS